IQKLTGVSFVERRQSHAAAGLSAPIHLGTLRRYDENPRRLDRADNITEDDIGLGIDPMNVLDQDYQRRPLLLVEYQRPDCIDYLVALLRRSELTPIPAAAEIE